MNQKHSKPLLKALSQALRASGSPAGDAARPAAILWTDPTRQWSPLRSLLLAELPELLVLGDYDPGQRTGPAIWLRCVIDRALEEPGLPEGRTPIIWLPGVGRQQLRAGEDCPPALQPLVELMFRGTLWLQRGGRDWTPSAFLTSQQGLGLDLSKDGATKEALQRALHEVAVTPLAQLQGRRLEAEDFDHLLTPDVTRDLLRWMADPDSTRAQLQENGWAAFCSRCREAFGFDPASEQDVVAGKLLGTQEGPWSAIWNRYLEAPQTYPGLVDLLRRSRPRGVLPFEKSPWPDLNDDSEDQLRQALEEVPHLTHEEACTRIEALEKEHGERRAWVWARLGLSPLADALEPLAALAAGVRSPLGGAVPDDFARAYAESHWRTDAAAWEALACCQTGDEPLIASIVHHLLEQWIDSSARALQHALDAASLPDVHTQGAVLAEEEGAVLFTDGLRYDLGARLAERLEGRGCRVRLRTRWAAVPTVTATGKPAVSPAAPDIYGATLGEDFVPELATKKPANARNVRDYLTGTGYQVLREDGFEPPLSSPARGWDEFGDIDSLGHKLGKRLPRNLNEELERLADRILHLLDAGWSSVRVVTDHGWLLLPGGLPKVDLPKHLTASRWARCAVMAGDSDPGVPRYPWSWNSSQWFATAPGVACFNKSETYAHGGISVQECVIPDIVVERGGDAQPRTSITAVYWRRLRCNVDVAGVVPGLQVDLRLQSPSGESVVAAVKDVPEDGASSVVLASDEHEFSDLIVVLLDATGQVLSYQSTRVGEDS